MPKLHFAKIALAIIVLGVVGAVVALAWPPTGYNNGYQPEQPIPYSHQIHAGKLQIPCQYCHSQVANSKHANVPTLNVCMNCHNNFKGAERPYLKQMKDAYAKGLSIPWVKVHMLPDFAHFNHMRHVQRGVACQECHGPIQEMKEVYQYAPLSMGWCVNCHRKPEYKASVNCATCHY